MMKAQVEEVDFHPELIDSHCHLDFPVFDDRRSTILKECKAHNISKFVVPGVKMATWLKLFELAQQHSDIYPAYGLHPYFIDEHQESDIEQLTAFLDAHPAVAIGEIGLDFYRDDLDKLLQEKLFAKQLVIAEKRHLPIILHVRKAHDNVLKMLRRSSVKGGVVHAFNGSVQQAHQYIEMGFKLGFGGAMTHPGAKHLRKLVSELPLNAIVVETDSPDMPPYQYNEPLNTPLSLLQVLNEISSLRDEDLKVISQQLLNNTHSIFPQLK